MFFCHAIAERGQDEGTVARSHTDRETHECPSSRITQRTSTERGTVAAGRQDSVGYGGRLEEVQDGDGNSTAGSSIALKGRTIGARDGR